LRGEVLRGHLDLLILAALEGEPGHGYRIVERIKERSAGVFGLGEGTVYPALHRIERSGLLASSWSTVEGRRRRVYRLTARGRRELGTRRSEWSVFARAVEAVVA
jgi:PadR family transcriptional regulator, regulatory protein PadR